MINCSKPTQKNQPLNSNNSQEIDWEELSPADHIAQPPPLGDEVAIIRYLYNIFSSRAFSAIQVALRTDLDSQEVEELLLRLTEGGVEGFAVKIQARNPNTFQIHPKPAEPRTPSISQDTPSISPSDVRITTLFHKTQITDPSQKPAPHQQPAFYAHSNYEVRKDISVRQAFNHYCDGYQWGFGHFEYDKQAQSAYADFQIKAGNATQERRKKLEQLRKDSQLIRRAERLVSQSVFVVEVDHDIKERTLDEFCDVHQSFLTNLGVYAVAESVRSRYNDPSDDTCNGQLRLRFFLVSPETVSGEDAMEFLRQKLVSAFREANFEPDEQGSNPVTGALSLAGCNHKVFDSFISPERLSEWNQEFKNQPSKTHRQPIDVSQLSDLPSKYCDALSEMKFPDTEGWSTESVPCLSGEHEHDGWDLSTNGTRVRKNKDESYTFKCHKCLGSWRFGGSVLTPLPPEPEPLPPSIFSKIPELHLLAKEVAGGLSDWTWQYPGTLNGQPREQTNRHLYNPLLKSVCPHCQKSVPTYIDIARLISGPHCPECNGHQHLPESIPYSYLQHELDRKPHDAIISDFEGYISDDPLLADKALWNQGGIFHLGAPMGSGKTTLIYHRAREAAESGALTLIVVPRVSLARSIYSDLRKDTVLGWGLFHRGHKGVIGELGAVCSLGWMPRLLKKIVKDYPDRPIRIFVDEIDFADSLRIAGIFKDLSKEIKDALKERKDAIGIVTAGQTAYTLGLEAIAKELDCNLTGYYLSPRPAQLHADLFIVDTTEVEHGKNRIVQAVVDKAKDVLATGKKCYILGNERTSAEMIAQTFGDKALLYDAYHKKTPEIEELHRLQRLPDDKSVLVTTTAVDVGVSIHDENAETIGFQVGNPLSQGGLSSTVQQPMRNRANHTLSIYLMKNQNALPLAPNQAIGFQTEHAKQKLNPAENEPEGLIEKLGIKDAMNSLEADQPEIFLKYHLQQAGYKVQVVEKDWESVGFEDMRSLRKQIKDVENEQVKEIALEILCPERMLTEQEIRQLDWKQLQPAPTFQLANERANELLQATGWNDNVERFVDESNLIATSPVQAFKEASVTDEMWEAAKAALQVGLAPDKVSRWEKGYLTTHHPSEALDEFEASREFEIHHRPDAIFIGTLVKALLEKLPRSPKPMEAVGQALIDAAQTPFFTDRLSAFMKDGSVSPAIAKKVRFLDLGKDAVPTEAHFDFVRCILDYYPARIAKVGDLYQLAAPTDTEQVEAFKRLMQCKVKHKHPDIDPDSPNNSDLTPPPAVDPFELEKERARQMKAQGKSRNVIASKIGMSPRWVSKVTQDVVKSDPKAELKAKTVQMKSDGLPLKQIAGVLGIPTSTIHRWLSERSHFGHANSNINTLIEKTVPKMGSIPTPLPTAIHIPALTPLSAPTGTNVGEVIRLATDDVSRSRGSSPDIALLDPSDVPRLMRSHVEDLGVNPFVPTAKALDAVTEYRGARLHRETSGILYDPEKYEALVGPFMNRLANRGRGDPSDVKIAFLLALRTWEGLSWVESLLPKVRFKHSHVSLFRDEPSASACLANIHGSWSFACLNEALVMHPLIPFVRHVSYTQK